MAVWTQGDRSVFGGKLDLLRVLYWIGVVMTLGWGQGGVVVAQPVPTLETKVSTDSVVIGERFTVSLVAEHDRADDVGFPAADAGTLVFGDLTVLGRSSVHERPTGDEQQVDSVAYEATTFSLDSVRVPPVPVQVAAGGDTSIARTPARTVTVVSVVGPDAKGIHGIAPLAPFPRPLWTWLLLGLVGAGLLAALTYLWWRRRESSDPRPVRRHRDTRQTPYEAATSWIRQLESYDLTDPDAIKPFYVELSNAVRVYLARELGVGALERTTRELVETLEHRPDVPTEAVARAQAVLELADLVKFADARPLLEDHEKAVREALAALDTIEAAPRARNSEKTTPERSRAHGVAPRPAGEREPTAATEGARPEEVDDIATAGEPGSSRESQ